MSFHTLNPVALQVGPFSIKWYGISYVLGILGWWKYSLWLVKKFPQKFPHMTRCLIDDYIGWALGGVVIGGRLGYVLFYTPAKYFAHPFDIIKVWEGGMSFHGGLLGVALCTLIYTRKKKISPLVFMDLACCGVPIGLFFGRIANFINGELFGRVTDVSWGMVFPQGGSFPRHPSQLYEAVAEGIVLFALLAFCALKTSAPQKRGFLTGMFLAGYSVGRMSVELFREPDAYLGYFVAGSTMGQLLSLPLLVAGIILMIRARKIS